MWLEKALKSIKKTIKKDIMIRIACGVGFIVFIISMLGVIMSLS